MAAKYIYIHIAVVSIFFRTPFNDRPQPRTRVNPREMCKCCAARASDYESLLILMSAV